jgi:uncharacterized protein YcbK (DUF882 family)
MTDRDPSIWISPHYRWDEFRCHDGKDIPERYRPSIVTLCYTRLEPIRSIWDRPVTILSGFRSQAWNARVEGAKNSMHCVGKAADIVVAGITAMEVADAIEDAIQSGTLPDGGVGRYKRWTHVDFGRPRRWRG